MPPRYQAKKLLLKFWTAWPNKEMLWRIFTVRITKKKICKDMFYGRRIYSPFLFDKNYSIEFHISLKAILCIWVISLLSITTLMKFSLYDISATLLP
jgi:hypothetical protein